MTSLVPTPEATKLYNLGWTYERLGERYGVSRQWVAKRIGQYVRHGRRPSVELACRDCGETFRAQHRSARRCPDCGVRRHSRQIREYKRQVAASNGGGK